MAFTSGQAVFATGADTTESKTAANARTALGLVIGTDVLAPSTILRSYLASTVTYNNNATLADTALSVAVEAGAIYAFDLKIYVTQAVKSLKIAFGGTATITNFAGQLFTGIGPGSGVDISTAGIYTSAGTVSAMIDGSDDTWLTYIGSVEINAAGTFLLRAAQTTADASNTNLVRGSTLILTKMS